MKIIQHAVQESININAYSNCGFQRNHYISKSAANEPKQKTTATINSTNSNAVLAKAKDQAKTIAPTIVALTRKAKNEDLAKTLSQTYNEAYIACPLCCIVLKEKILKEHINNLHKNNAALTKEPNLEKHERRSYETKAACKKPKTKAALAKIKAQEQVKLLNQTSNEKYILCSFCLEPLKEKNLEKHELRIHEKQHLAKKRIEKRKENPQQAEFIRINFGSTERFGLPADKSRWGRHRLKIKRK